MPCLGGVGPSSSVLEQLSFLTAGYCCLVKVLLLVVFDTFCCARQVVTPPLPPPALPLRYPTATIPWKAEVTPVGSLVLFYR